MKGEIITRRPVWPAEGNSTVPPVETANYKESENQKKTRRRDFDLYAKPRLLHPHSEDDSARRAVVYDDGVGGTVWWVERCG